MKNTNELLIAVILYANKMRKYLATPMYFLMCNLMCKGNSFSPVC